MTSFNDVFGVPATGNTFLLKQILREAELREGLHFGLSIADSVNLLMAAAEGKIAQFVRSEFRLLPTQSWVAQWPYLVKGFVVETVS